MSARTRSLTIALGAAVMLLALGLHAAPPARAHHGTGNRLTIYATACPPGYAGADYYADCAHDPLAGVTFVAHGGDGPGITTTTDVDGVAVFDRVAGGPFPRWVLVGADLPGGLVRPVVRCWDAAGNAVAADEDGGRVGVEFATPDTLVHCDWFVLSGPSGDPAPPDGGTLAVLALVCPVGFDYQDFAACAEPLVGVDFGAYGASGANGATVATDAAGLATFPLFAEDLPGAVAVSAAPPADAAPVVACFDAAGAAVDYVYTDAGITLVAVPGGAEIACNWFVVPAAEGAGAGTITVYRAVCPPGYAGGDHYADCFANPGAGAWLGTGAVGTDVGVGGTTDAAGFVTLPLPLDASTGPGAVRLYETTNPKGGAPPAEIAPLAVSCSKQGGTVWLTVVDIGAGGVRFDAAPGDRIRCDWYGTAPAG